LKPVGRRHRGWSEGMRTKSLVLVVIALGCGLVASIGISEVIKNRPAGEAPLEADQVMVAAIDIDIGKKLDAENVKIEQWPRGKVPEGAFRSLEQVQDQFTRSRLYAGEPILRAKLINSSDSSAAKIPDGYVVIPVRVELDTVIGLIQPGDHVDVVVFLRQGPDIPRTGSYTILRMARVFAVNTQTDRATDEKGHEVAAKTVSLLVKPKQSQKLTLATELGKIRLALRRPTDEVPDEGEIDRDLPAIFRDAEVVAMDKPDRKPDVSPAPVAVLPEIPFIAPRPEVPVAGVQRPMWSMQVMSPTDIRSFDWSNNGELPRENLSSEPSSSAVPSSDLPQIDAPPVAAPSLSDDLSPPTE
jgi:pilus assembly protein CpaB